jgi:hypothetical protein
MRSRKERLSELFRRRPWLLVVIVLLGILADIGLLIEIKRLQRPPAPHLIHAPGALQR